MFFRLQVRAITPKISERRLVEEEGEEEEEEEEGGMPHRPSPNINKCHQARILGKPPSLGVCV